jgi:hypothetical protein
VVSSGELVLAVGDRVEAWGRLIAHAAGDVWFEPPMPIPAVLCDPPLTPAANPGLAVPVRGADFALVDDRYERDGAVEGWASITGSWQGEAGIAVTNQSTIRPDPIRRTPTWDKPPLSASARWLAAPGRRRESHF